MTVEMIQAVNENREPAGIFSRSEIHKRGLWHETFHCWVIKGEDVLMQIRSRTKKDFPGMLDISAAGHLAAGERVHDGVRELHEEIGVLVDFDQLTPLAVVKDEIRLPGFIDREWTHVFLLEVPEGTEFTLQEEEVEAVEWLRFSDLELLWEGTGIRTQEGRWLKKENMVPHENRYMQAVFRGIRQYLASKG